MKNTSGLSPRGRAVLVEMYEPAKKRGGLIEIPDIVREKTDMMEIRAKVIAIGPSCWNDEPSPRAEIGEFVLVTKFAGYMTKGPRDGKRYRLVNDRDIFCAIDPDVAEQVQQEEKPREVANG